VDDLLRKAQINRAVISPNGLIVIFTILNGAVAIDKSGQKIWAINTSNVLQNNPVLGIAFDRDHNIWLALDKGIAFVHQNSSLRCIQSFYPDWRCLFGKLRSTPFLYCHQSGLIQSIDGTSNRTQPHN
jgi:ligand-binding sensor domain-containing protein